MFFAYQQGDDIAVAGAGAGLAGLVKVEHF